MARLGLDNRATIVTGDVRAGGLPEAASYDFALLANVVYYVPVDERATLLRTVRESLTPDGAMVVVTTALTDDLFSRHFDLLLRAQEGEMALPTWRFWRGSWRMPGCDHSPRSGLHRVNR